MARSKRKRIAFGSASDRPATPTLPLLFQDREQIADPLNVMVNLSMFEKRILGCPEMQRLRRIKQLGFVNLVYPAAEYTRFVHSIGVCHQAKNIVDKINTNLEQQPRYRQWRKLGREDGVPEVALDDVRISNVERVVISAAALLHDLPHAAFSHEIEGVSFIEKLGVAVPVHDRIGENCAFFQYLFNLDVSTLAKLIRNCNSEFFEALIAYARWCKDTNNDHRPECSLLSLIDEGAVNDDGFVLVKNDENAQIRFSGDIARLPAWLGELPLLGVLMFEIHLFEHQHTWLTSEEQKLSFRLSDQVAERRTNSLAVKIAWHENTKLDWRPCRGWFRAYRHDIICDTICADLIDYVKRDGYHTGIVSEMDLKFLDRMLIARGLLPAAEGEDANRGRPKGHVLQYEQIPESCEHVVFDVYDHKRGFLRQSVFTEVLAYLQARYLLCERVYGHRVVEGARAMLQRMTALLASSHDGAGPCLSVDKLHPLLHSEDTVRQLPGDDLSFLRWVQAIDQDTLIDDTSKKRVEMAQELAYLLEDRRIFREAVIIDGVHGCKEPPAAGAEEACRRLANAFLPDSEDGKQKVERILENLDADLRRAWREKRANSGLPEPKTTCVLGLQKWDKRYKAPLVLTADPSGYVGGTLPAIDIIPLSNRENPKNIEKQLDAMRTSYNSLWRVYLFVHPVFHAEAFGKVFENEVEPKFLQFANENTGVKWQNAVHFPALLPREGEDLDIQAFVEATMAVQHAEVLEKSIGFVIDTLSDLQKRDPGTVADGQTDMNLQTFKAVFFAEDKGNHPKVGTPEFNTIRGLVKQYPSVDLNVVRARFLEGLEGEPLAQSEAARVGAAIAQKLVEAFKKASEGLLF